MAFILNPGEDCEDVPGFKFARILNILVVNMLGFWISRVTQKRFTYFCRYDRVLNIHWDAIMEGFWIFQDFEYARFLHIQALTKVQKMVE